MNNVNVTAQWGPSDLQAARLRLGLSQRRLGDRLGVTAGTILRWENPVSPHHIPMQHPELVRLAMRCLERDASELALALLTGKPRPNATTPVPVHNTGTAPASYYVPLSQGSPLGGPCDACGTTIPTGAAYWFGTGGWICDGCKRKAEAEASPS